MSTPNDPLLTDAAYFGTAAGLRAFTPAAALALKGGLGTGTPSRVIPLLALGELGGDKLPIAGPRTGLPALAPRVVVAALGGQRIGGAQAAVAAAGCAIVAAYGGQHTRKFIGRITGRPDLQVALVEDLLAVALAYRATRALPSTPAA